MIYAPYPPHPFVPRQQCCSQSSGCSRRSGDNQPMTRVPFAHLQQTLAQALTHLGVAPERAALSSRLIAETDRDGVSTHGIARFPRFAEMVRLGSVDPSASPKVAAGFGALERWDGQLGPGNLAAYAAMARAMELAQAHGLGGVALANTTHWQRGGTYGWQAADAGFAAMCWTNTMPNQPPWGASSPALGNNPLVIAIPRSVQGTSEPVVLDMAMSQFSYGTLAAYRQRGEKLPVPGGFDVGGKLTDDPAAIEESQRALPIGFWKGSGLAFALDVLGAMLSAGKATHEITPDPLKETGVSQVFLAVAPQALATQNALGEIAERAIAALHGATPLVEGRPARYPGERVLELREESMKLGVPVDDAAWAEVQKLAGGSAARAETRK